MPDDFQELSVALVRALTDALVRARNHDDPRIAEILATVKGLKTMSSTISEQVDAASAANEASAAQIMAALTGIAAELTATAPPAGSTITQAQADRATAVALKITSAVAELSALVPSASNQGAVASTGTIASASIADPVVPAEPPPGAAEVVFDADDTTPNSPDGRNAPQLVNFDPNAPITA